MIRRFRDERRGAVAAVLLAGCTAAITPDDPDEPDPASTGGTSGAIGTRADAGRAGAAGSAGSSVTSNDAGMGPMARVAISEIMYHPVLENAATEDHEFIELANSGDERVALGGWKLSFGGQVRLTFAPGASIPAKSFVIVARSRAALLAVPRWKLTAAQVVAEYTGELDNGGDSVALTDDKGALVDSVQYDDLAPWPVGADALGGGEDWLPALQPFAQHQYMGRSLERWSYTVNGSDPRNWEASPVDGATPARANTVHGEPPAIVLSHLAQAEGAAGAVRADAKVTLAVGLSAGAASESSIEFRADMVEKVGTPATVPLGGAAPNLTAVLPAHPANTIVRYRILARRGGAVERISPRATDPYEWHAYFVPPPLPATRTHQIFISPASWTRMWTNLKINAVMGPNDGCTLNASWDARVPATFVHDGKVHDVLVRYTGSRYQRPNRINLPAWKVPGPAEPAPNAILSWRVAFPRWSEFEGRRTMNLNKQVQSCPGVLNALEAKLMWDAGVPTTNLRFARLHINGAYYGYMMEVENIDERFVDKYLEKGKAPVGDLFKFDGGVTDEGLWASANWHPINVNPRCPQFTPLQRYRATYERQTHEWKDESPKGHEEVIKLITDLAAIQAKPGVFGAPAVRAYLDRSFDVTSLMSTFAVRNFAGTWDDAVHNYYAYKRGGDGKWMLLPTDFDLDWGGDPSDGFGRLVANPPTLSFFHGDVPGGFSAGSANVLKTQLLRAYRTEYVARVTELASTALAPANVARRLDEAMAEFDLTAYMEAPARRCDVTGRVETARKWIKQRLDFLAGGVK